MATGKPKRGGRRPGAGRPRTGRKPRSMIAISPDRKQLLGEYAASAGCTLLQAADRAVVALLDASEPEG